MPKDIDQLIHEYLCLQSAIFEDECYGLSDFTRLWELAETLSMLGYETGIDVRPASSPV